MKKYVLDIRFGKTVDVDVDHAPDVTDEEFEKVLVECRKFLDTLSKESKFRAVDDVYVAGAIRFITRELNNIGTVVRCEQIERFRVVWAFMA